MINFDKLIKIASLTPSGDNLQPWCFEIDENHQQLMIFHNNIISAHSFNPDNIASCISFGMMMFSIEDEALRQGFIVKFKIDEAALTNEECFIECQFEKNTGSKKALFSEETYFSRKTSRDPYLDKNLPLNEMKNFIEELNDLSDLMDFKINSKVSDDCLKSMKKIEKVFWNKKNYLREIFHWVHFKRNNYTKMKRGFYWKELGVKISDLPFILLIKYATPLAIITYNAIAHLLTFRQFSKSLDHSGLLMLSLKKRPNVLECLELGKTVMRLWLKITELGMVSQPLSIQTFFISFTSWGFYDKEWPQATLKQLEFNLKKDFNVKDSFKPFWLFRFGFELEKNKGITSLRLTKEELLK
jgi:hypothetical protein